MSGGYSTPCSGELEFWTVMRSQMVAQTHQLKRIADALESRAESPLRGPRVGDLVVWTDPETNEATCGWRVATVPEYDADGSYRDGVYYIERPDGSGAEVHRCEIAVYKTALAEGGKA